MRLNRTTPGHRLSLVVALLVLGVPAVLQAAGKSRIDGFWDAPAGRLVLKSKDGHVIGVLTSVVDGVGLKVGDKVVDGTLDDDNVTADIRVGVLVPKCGAAEGTAFVVLLATRSGKLTGGASSKVACAANLSSLTMMRSKPAAAGADGKQPATVGEAEASGVYDPHGKRQVPFVESVKALLKDGQQFMEEGDFEHARAQFQKALAKDPKVGETYNGIGATFAGRNDYESAIEWYKKGLEAAPGFGDLYYNLACAYAQQTKPQLALRFLKLAASKGYAELPALDEDHDLDPIRSDPEFVLVRGLMEPIGGAPAPGATPAPAPVPAAITAPTPAPTSAPAPIATPAP